MLRAFCFASLAILPSVAERAVSEADGTQFQAATGMVLRDRYVLREFIESRRDGAIPGVSFPHISRHGFKSNPTYMGQGSFGDVWKAFDTELQKEVAVKIFYTKTRTSSKYLTWNDATDRQKRELTANAQECKLVKDILAKSHINPKGASRICACYEEHVLDAKRSDKVAFLVQEMCGKSLTQHYLDPHKDKKDEDVEEARRITKQILQGLAFLQQFDPPIIHHDLKPDNICVSNEGVKIIDWGGVVFGTRSAMYESAVATPLYTPPEADFQKNPRNAHTFDMPAHTYDVYAAGLIHMEMLCPRLEPRDWFYSRPLTEAKAQSVVTAACRFGAKELGDLAADFQLIGRMIANPASSRPSPMVLLENRALTPRQAEPEQPAATSPGGGAASFRKGDLVEYWSATFKKWVGGIVVAVHENGQYDINYPNGQQLRYNASPKRMRHQGLRFKVGDEVEYLSVSKKTWIPAKITGVDEEKATYDITYEYNGYSYDRTSTRPKNLRAPAARVNEAYRPDPNARYSSRVEGETGAGSPLQAEVIGGGRGGAFDAIAEESEDDKEGDSFRGSDPSMGVRVTSRGAQQESGADQESGGSGGGGESGGAGDGYEESGEVTLASPKVGPAPMPGDMIQVTVWAETSISQFFNWDKIELRCGAEARVMEFDRKLTTTAKGVILLDRDAGDPFIGQDCALRAFITTKKGVRDDRKLKSAATAVKVA